MNLNEFSQAKSEFSHVVRMVRNHIADEHFFSKFILSVSNSHERFGETMDTFHIKCQIWRHASSPCFKAEGASPKIYSIFYRPKTRGVLVSINCPSVIEGLVYIVKIILNSMLLWTKRLNTQNSKVFIWPLFTFSQNAYNKQLHKFLIYMVKETSIPTTCGRWHGSHLAAGVVYTANSLSVLTPCCHFWPLRAWISGSWTTFGWLLDLLLMLVHGVLILWAELI